MNDAFDLRIITQFCFTFPACFFVSGPQRRAPPVLAKDLGGAWIIGKHVTYALGGEKVLLFGQVFLITLIL